MYPVATSLWSPGPTIRELLDIEPRLASWDAAGHPAQMRLRSYLRDVSAQLGSLPDAGLYLHLSVDIGESARLLHHHDLENYLTPLVRHLGGQRFVLVSACKRAGGGSSLRVGYATRRELSPLEEWAHLTIRLWGQRVR